MRTLFTRLLGGLLALLLVIGGVVFALSVYNARNYRLEVTQKLHVNLAESLVKESLLMSGGMIYAEAVEGVFHTLMVINPAIEVYLLDATGKLLRYSAPEGKVKLALVDLEEGTRIVSNVVGCEIDEVHIGMKVEAVWKPEADRQGAITDILYFRPVASAADVHATEADDVEASATDAPAAEAIVGAASAGEEIADGDAEGGDR